MTDMYTHLVNPDRLSYVKQFAACNPSMMDLKFYTPEDADVIYFYYRIERDTEGRITGIVEVRPC